MKKESKKFLKNICGILETAYVHVYEDGRWTKPFKTYFDTESKTKVITIRNENLALSIEYWIEKHVVLHLGEGVISGGTAIIRNLSDEDICIPMSVKEYNEITCNL